LHIYCYLFYFRTFTTVTEIHWNVFVIGLGFFWTRSHTPAMCVMSFQFIPNQGYCITSKRTPRYANRNMSLDYKYTGLIQPLWNERGQNMVDHVLNKVDHVLKTWLTTKWPCIIHGRPCFMPWYMATLGTMVNLGPWGPWLTLVHGHKKYHGKTWFIGHVVYCCPSTMVNHGLTMILRPG